MKRNSTAMLLMLFCFSGMASAASPAAAPAAGQGWTGATRPLDVIHARGELMTHMELLLQPIDTITIQKGPVRNVELLHQNAQTVAVMLNTVPHLFPPTTNLYDPKAETPKTIALPAIWQSFDAFYALAHAASLAAVEMSHATGDQGLRAASLKLRASCDACHALYLRKYVPSKVSDKDTGFDFDSALGTKKK